MLNTEQTVHCPDLERDENENKTNNNNNNLVYLAQSYIVMT